MGEIHKLYPSPEDSHDGNIFVQFKKVFDQREKNKTETRTQYHESTKRGKEELLKCMLKSEKYRVVVEGGKEILCMVMDFHGKNYTEHPYGHHHHILLAQEGKRYDCSIEHRLPPYEEAYILNASSWLVKKEKFGGGMYSLHDEQDNEQQEQKHTLSLA